MNWPSSSTDLTSRCLFLRGYLLERGYDNKQEVLTQLEGNFNRESKEITYGAVDCFIVQCVYIECSEPEWPYALAETCKR